MKPEKILSFWHALEAMTSQEVVRVDAGDPSKPVYGMGLSDGSVVPWSADAHTRKPIEKGFEWKYSAQCGVYSVDAVTSMLLRSFDADQGSWFERGGDRARVFDLSFDSAGLPLGHTFALSLSAWSAGQILRDGGGPQALQSGGISGHEGLPMPEHSIPEVNSGFKAFDSLSRHIAQWIQVEARRMRDEGSSADAAWILTLVQDVARRLFGSSNILMLEELCRVRSNAVKLSRLDASATTTAPQQDFDILSSFFVEDLQRVRQAVLDGKVGKGLLDFLAAGQGKKAQKRIDVRAVESTPLMELALRPSRMPPGRWPSDHSLVLSQQLAVNEAWAKLRNGAGIFAVNGPPGTGKTTLLRDVVAAVITDRASVLIRGGSGLLGAKASHRLGDTWIPYYPLHASLKGFSIVISSANNGAVENFSLELPGESAVPKRVQERSDYYRELGCSVSKKKAWGLLAAPLGKRANRTEFLSSFWWNKSGLTDKAGLPIAPGLREALVNLRNRTVSPHIDWDTAVNNFKQAQATEQAMRSFLEKKAQRPERISSLASDVDRIDLRLKAMDDLLADRETLLKEVDAKLSTVDRQRISSLAQRNEIDCRISAHRQDRPGILEMIFTLGKAQKEWREQLKLLNADADAVSAQWPGMDRARDSYLHQQQAVRNAIKDITAKASALDDELDKTIAQLQDEKDQLKADMIQLGALWPRMDMPDDERERIEPWAHRQWTVARENVFLSALDVHRAFIERHPAEMLANLSLASDWLSGKQMPPELAQLALDSLCLVVPVISTTFASVSRMFSQLGQESIGYTLIDEGGQALLSHAVGVIWRSKRTIVVGDPRQLEAVFTIPPQVESAMASVFKVGQLWMPSSNSVQGLADQGAVWGTWLPSDRGDKEWVGCPLRLHRRCDEPAFSISNKLAYGGMMVHGKSRSVSEGPQMSSGWIDVRGVVSDGHWLKEEGDVVRSLLSELIGRQGVAPDQIALITPFKDCAMRLKAMASAYGIASGRAGTVHTAQGKEADTVVLVLGGDPRLPGAKAWAAAKPNLLNVAVSRMKKRLYVVGNRQEWSKHKHFSLLHDHLSAISFQSEAACQER